MSDDGARSSRARPDDRTARAQDALARFCAFGEKRVGGNGDRATGEWVEGELAGLGYAVRRQVFTTNWSDDRQARLEWAGGSVDLTGHPASPAGTVTGALVRCGPGSTDTDVAGRIVVLDLPHGRWSSARDSRIQAWVGAAVEGGARAIVLVTHGPSGLAIRLNTGRTGYDFKVPVAILSPRDADRLPGQDGREAVLCLEREEAERSVFNVVGRIDRGAARTLVLSTPRSGWSDCAGERGSGLAAWLLLVAQAARTIEDINILALCPTAHERGHAGMAIHLAEGEPAIQDTVLWVHIGANAAARDWREVPEGLSPLPSADPQRFLAVSQQHLRDAGVCFAGSPGFEVPYDVSQGAGGELGDIAAAGYTSVIGVFGAHRFHHTRGDDLSCVSAELSVDLAERMQRLIRLVLSRTG